ncbi:prepilin-type N-terminal cleavage/methylation domain-containing protein [Candidatus Poribacteria bacterium]|nr:prepilin-type N-terminal cleavage/methylation domain-containing protein [Candidatus Poribacteria bacterium]
MKMKRSAGFTLIEVIVAVGIVAILSAAVAVSVVKYINDGRIARSASDAQTIGTAVVTFLKDTGKWPVSDDGVLNDAGELSRLVGLDRADVANAAMIPDGAGTATGDGNWDGGGDGGTAGAMEDLLILNADANTTPLYTVSKSAPVVQGWNGPYIDTIPLDPWGNPFVCNIRYARGASVTGVTAAEEASHSVFVLSAGPNGLFETSFDDATALPATGVGGDDVGFLVSGATS